MFLRAELRRRRRGQGGDEGFTLLEVVVALLVLTLVGSGTVLLLVSGSRAAGAARLYTEAKNLAEQRVEAMRTLQFHVDRQNGPYIDLLDLYYTNLSTTATTRTRGAITDTSKTGAGETGKTETQSVRWYSSGTSPQPTNGPFYQVSVSSIPNYENFKQVIDTQFLNAAGTPIAASNFTTGGTYSSYDSQTEGDDSPPTGLLGVTVTTSWSVDGVSKSYTLSTRIADASSTTTYITSQGVGEYLRVTSYGPYATATNADALSVDVNRAEADGSETTGSNATATATAFEAVDNGQDTDVVGATGEASSPGSTTTSSPGAVFSRYPTTAPDCHSWATAGVSSVSNVTASTTSGLPQVPSTVGSGARVSSSLSQIADDSCEGDDTRYAMWFDNQSSSYDTTLGLNTSKPLVSIPDSSGLSSAATTGAAWVNATSSASTPHSVTSGASVATLSGSSSACPYSSTSKLATCIELFPGLSFVSDGGGLVDIAIYSASLSCSASVPTGGGNATYSATTSVTGAVSYWAYNGGSPKRVTVPLSSTLSGGTDPLAAVPLTTVVGYVNGTPVTLSSYISNWSSTQTVSQQVNTGLYQVPGLVDITTQPVRSGDPTSAIGVEAGALSCAAADNR